MFPLTIICAALIIGFGAIAFILFLRMKSPAPPPVAVAPLFISSMRPCFLFWPDRWLLVRTDNLPAVERPLQLHDPEPCSWLEGLAQEEKLFIAPAAGNWVLATGAGLPDPADDVDACFRFVSGIARRFDEVQYFSVSHPLHHHAWIKAKWGKIARAYVWAGETLWNQGALTEEERDLGLTCYGYGEECPNPLLNPNCPAALNVEKVPLLATRWGVNLVRIYEHLEDQRGGMRGDPC